MTAQEAALVSISERLETLRVPYMVIGGMANAVWGEPRATLDVDVTVWVDEEEIETISGRFADRFTLLPDNPAEFIRTTRVLPLETEAGVRIDLIFGMLPFEQAAIERSVSRTVGNRPVRFCTAEDLILYKIFSERDQDLRDVQAILRRRGPELDRTYLDPCVQELAEALERPDVWSNYERWLLEP